MMTRAEEQRLIRRAMAGDREGAASLLRYHQASLYAYLVRMCGRPELAEDVTQEAFVRVLTHLHRFDPKYRFSTWLFTIARRILVNACQRHKPAFDTDAVGAMAATWTEPAGDVARAEATAGARDAIQRALLTLPVMQREVVVLFHQQDWPIALIAQHLDIPEGTVKSHLHRGRQRLREAMRRDRSMARAGGEVLP